MVKEFLLPWSGIRGLYITYIFIETVKEKDMGIKQTLDGKSQKKYQKVFDTNSFLLPWTIFKLKIENFFCWLKFNLKAVD